MLELNKHCLANTAKWEELCVEMPKFDLDALTKNTAANPSWVHFGAGNIFRGFMANIQQKLLDMGLVNTGIVAVETFDHDIIDKIYEPHDNLSLLVSLNPDGKIKKKLIASVTESIAVHSADNARLKQLFCAPSLQMVSFTITEKGYALNDAAGNLMDIVRNDILGGPSTAKHVMSIVTAMLYERYKNLATPLAMVSMDNCSHNGEKLAQSVLTIAKSWLQNGFVEAGFIDYLTDDKQVAFPWTMVDKITPRPDESVLENLTADGFLNIAPLITSKGTFIAPFVNAEVPEYLVIEDCFPNGRAKLEAAGVYLTDRDTVNSAERMKVTTCLNPLHTALAVFGCLLGYTRIYEEMRDPDLKQLVEKIGYQEGMTVVVNPKILDPQAFIKEVLEMRFPNPFIPDAPQRIATDTSQKIAIRFGETLKSYASNKDLDIHSLVYIPLVIAAWLRYLLAVNDKLQPMQCSSDPLLKELQMQLQGIEVGNPKSYTGQLKKILENENIFAVNLVDLGLSVRIEDIFLEMLAGAGAVRNTLKKALKI